MAQHPRLLTAALILLLPEIALAQPGSYHVRTITTPPTLDGRIADDCWQGAQVAEGFSHPNTGEPAQTTTRFAAVRDAANLYVFIVCTEPKRDQIRMNFTGHDDSLWANDCVELFIDPTDNRQEYAHIVVNPAGATYDGWVVQGGLSQDSSFESAAEAATQVNAWNWTAEIKVPFAGLRIDAEAGATWAFNVAREKKTDPAELSAWVSTGHGFHRPDKFGTLTGMDAAYRPFMLQTHAPSLANAHFAGRDNNRLEGTLQFAISNSTGAVAPLNVEARLRGAGGEAVLGIPGDFPQGDFTVQLPASLPGAGTYRAEIRLYDYLSGRLVHYAASTMRLDLAPLEISLITPWYRDAIFSTCPVDRIEGIATLRLGEATAADATVQVRLLGSDGAEIAGKSLRVAGDTAGGFAFDAASLPYGEYIIEATATRDGTAVASARRTVKKLAPAEHEVCIDRQRRVLVDGKPFFAWGFMGSGVDERLPAAGFNIIHTYVARYAHRDDKLTAWLDEAHAAGLQVVMYPYPGKTGFYGYNDTPRLTDDESAEILAFVDKYKDHPALFGWYMCDEPRGAEWRSEIIRLAGIIAQADPYHPTIPLDNGARGVVGLADAGEILWIDPYPGFGVGKGPHVPMNKVAIAIQDIWKGLGPETDKLLWVAPQAFSYGGDDPERSKVERAPTYLEERTMAYMALVHGADGIVYYAWAYAQKFPELRVGLLEGLSREMQILMPVLLEGEDVGGETMCEPEDGIIHTRAISYDGHIYVIACNMTEKPCKGYVRAMGIRGIMNVLSEDRTVEVSGDGAIDDQFAAYATHIYTTRTDLPELRSLDDIAEMIAAAVRADADAPTSD